MSTSTDASEQYRNSNSTKSSKIAASKLEAGNLTRRVYRVVLHIENSCRKRMSSYPRTVMLQSGPREKFGLQLWNLQKSSSFPVLLQFLQLLGYTILPSEFTERLAGSLGYHNLTLRIHRTASSFPQSSSTTSPIYDDLAQIPATYPRPQPAKKPNPDHLFIYYYICSRVWIPRMNLYPCHSSSKPVDVGFKRWQILTPGQLQLQLQIYKQKMERNQRVESTCQAPAAL